VIFQDNLHQLHPIGFHPHPYITRSIFADEYLCWLRLLGNYIGSKGRDGRDGRDEYSEGPRISRCCMEKLMKTPRTPLCCHELLRHEKGDVVTARPASLGKDLAEATQPQGLQSEI
jgi:hypothetical protein